MDEIALDVHAHLIPIDNDHILTTDGVQWRSEDQSLVVDGHTVGLKKLFDPQALITWMDEYHVASAWVSAPPAGYRPKLGETDARIWTGYLNEGLARIAAAHSPRLKPLVHLTVEHPALAEAIAVEALSEGQNQFAMSAGGNGILLSNVSYDALWSALHEAGAFLFIHPGEGCDPRLDPFYLHNLLGNPHETALAASHLVLGRVIERFPGIRFCLAHAGGNTAAVAGRLQRGHDTMRPGLDRDAATPMEMFRHIFVDCIAHQPEALELAAAVFGEDKIVFGSDWPFPMGIQDPNKQLESVRPDLRALICGDNPRRLLNKG